MRTGNSYQMVWVLSLWLIAGCSGSAVPTPAPEATVTTASASPTWPPEAGPSVAPPTGYPLGALTEAPATSRPVNDPTSTPLVGYPIASLLPPSAATLTSVAPSTAPTGGAGFALRFFGTGQGNIDRVKVRLDPPVPADVGGTTAGRSGDFTLEFWMKADADDNVSPGAACGQNDGWITGNIMFDRDVWGAGDNGDFGLSVTAGQIAFGVSRHGDGNTVCSTTPVADGGWHHVAVTREGASGRLRIFVDGRLDAEGNGPTGDVSYRDGRGTSYPNDPYLVLGAEKHDYNRAEYPSYRGWLDEARLSTILRYTTDFARPTTPFQPDADTAALWHFDEGAGDVAGDSAPDGQSPGSVKIGGPEAAPQWVPSDAPLAAIP